MNQTSNIKLEPLDIKVEPYSGNASEDDIAEDPEHNDSEEVYDPINNELKRHFDANKEEHTGKYNIKQDLDYDPDYMEHNEYDDIEGLFKCLICHRQYITKRLLRNHITIHDLRYQCTVCSQRYHYMSHLMKHMGIHTKHKKSSIIHMRSHTGDKPHHCDVCQKRFAEKGTLTKHMSTHTREKLYECDICQKLFTRSNYLKQHKHIHTGEKPYQCDICDDRFTYRNSHRVHMTRLHTGNKPYRCEICEYRSEVKSSLTVHMYTQQEI